MLFGRQGNMVRRANRPYENHHRDRRRRGVDRSLMLESQTRRRRPSLLARLIAALLGGKR